jgi:hypothetical protein
MVSQKEKIKHMILSILCTMVDMKVSEKNPIGLKVIKDCCLDNGIDESLIVKSLISLDLIQGENKFFLTEKGKMWGNNTLNVLLSSKN